MLSPREKFVAFRRSLPPTPRLATHRVKARGLEFAVYMTPEVPGQLPLACVNGGLIYGHRLLWPALSPVATKRQLIFYDQRGRGESQAPPGPRAATIEHDAGDLGALRTAIGIRQWDVLGHSWGGGIAMLGTERDQGGVRRLVLVNSVGPTSAWLPHMHEDALQRLSPSDRVVLQRLDPLGLASISPGIHSSYSRAIYPAYFGDPDLAQLFVPPRSESVTGAAVAAALRQNGYDWRALVRAVHVPTLVIHGEKDLLPPGVAREIVSLIPHSSLDLVPGAGHMPFWESPEHFFASVERFLSHP